jgi:Na+/H+-dicarboxylate symporters
VFFGVIRIIVQVAPIGAFGAMAFTIGAYGLGSLVNLAALVATFYLTSILFVLVVLGTIAHLAGFSIIRFIAYIKDEASSCLARRPRKPCCRICCRRWSISARRSRWSVW